MSQLELLWKLENHSNLLEEHRKHLYIIENNLELTNLEKKHMRLKEQITNLKIKLDNNNRELREKENNLKNITFSLKELDTQLYDGSKTDLKQLNYLLHEKDNITERIAELETNIIDLMGISEEISSDLAKLDKHNKRIDKDIYDYKKKNNSICKDLKLKIEYEDKEAQKYSKDIDSKLLSQFNALRKSRGRALVYVVKNVCTGCNMFVPSYLNEKIRNKEEIITCEYCGRILYHQLPSNK